MSIATQITATRQRLAFTRTAFAALLGISTRTLSNYETSSTTPNVTTWAAHYAALLPLLPDLSAIWWLTAQGPMEETPTILRLEAENGLLRAYNAHLRATAPSETKAVSHVSLFETKSPVTP